MPPIQIQFRPAFLLAGFDKFFLKNVNTFDNKHARLIMFKKITFTLLLLPFLAQTLNAQNHSLCGQAEVMNNLFKLHPEVKIRFDSLQQSSRLKTLPQNHSSQAALVPTYTIPVVFHILHTGGAENISDAQILDEMKILNMTYQKQNADTINVVPSFSNNIANVQFEFRLATLDPSGNCTNGIIRHYTNKTNWSANDFNAFIYTWPSSKYLNIYIVKSIDIAPAYSFLPGTAPSPAADVIVSQHNICGSIGTSNVANSWAITHEAAHWFDIPHIWGFSNQPGVVCGDDGVQDTPITKGFTVCNLANTAVCNPGIIENVQNYMDYAPCKIMFTNGQKAKMHACVNGFRSNLSTPANLQATGVTPTITNCVPKLEIIALPSTVVCSGKPIVINSYTYNANPTSYLWSANNNALISNAALANPTFTFNGIGNTTVNCAVSNANGSSSASLVITAVVSTAQVTNTHQESFESISLPANWSVINATTPLSLWDITNVAASHGNQSMFVNAENSPGGSVEILETPSYDFLNNPGSIFTFNYAYAMSTAAQKDVFKVQASNDCGGSWKDIYVPSPSFMASGSGGISQLLFMPLSNQWKSYVLSTHPNFLSFLNSDNVRIRFYFKEDSAGNGNRIYLDQINFESPLGVNEFSKSINFNLYPNPTNGGFTMAFTLSDIKKLKVSIITSSGQNVVEKTEEIYSNGQHKLLLNEENKLPPGVYFLKAKFDGLSVVKKVVVE